MPDESRPSLLTLLKRRRRRGAEFWKIWGPSIALVVLFLIVAWLFVEPAPPGRVVLATGPADGAYHAFAGQYAEHFGRNGIDLVRKSTAGSVENFDLLTEEGGEVSVAILQGGVASPDLVDEESESLATIANLYLEPLWVFYRGDETIDRLDQLTDKRISVGPEGSGTRRLAMQLLSANGVDDETKFAPLGGQAAADALKAGELDAAMFVISPRSPIVRELLVTDGVRLMSFDRGDAYDRLYPSLTSVTLERGVIDLDADLPTRDVELVAAVASLVCRDDLHGALIPLFIEAAGEAHGRAGLLMGPGQFPSIKHVEFPVRPEARHFFKNGRSFLYRYLPFWAASLIDRTKIMLLPLVTLLIPLLRIAPPLYRWRIRRRIYRWYGVLRAIEGKLREAERTDGAGPFEREQEMLAQPDQELAEVWVPLSYMEEFYHLRLHMEYVARRLRERVAKRTDAAT